MPSHAFRHRLLAAAALAPLASIPAHAAPVPVVDTRSSSPVTNVSREHLENLPVGRRPEDLIRTCPSNTIPTISRQPDVLIDGKPLVDLNCVQPADIDMIEVYQVHNAARAEYGAPPLVWDPALVQSSAGVAQQRVRTGTLEHSSREGRGTVRENISQGLPWWSTRQLMANWEKEKKNFVPGIFPNVSRTHNWYDIGHWAQMIWIQTVLIGCTKATGGSAAWLVCHYNPGGNKDGKTVGIPPLQTQQVASAPDATIRPRLIGGDYGGKIAQGETPKTELPWHPQFNPHGKRPEVDQELVLDATEQSTGGRIDYDEFVKPGVATSLFDLGIYGKIEPWDNSGLAYQSFDRDPDHEYVGLSEAFAEIRIPLIGDLPAADLSYEYGYDGGLFVGYDMGSFRLESEVAYKKADLESFDTAIEGVPETTVDTKVEQPNLPKAEVFNSNGANDANANSSEDSTEADEPDAKVEEGDDGTVEGMAPVQTAKNEDFNPCRVPITKSSSMIPEELYVLTLQAEFVAKKGDLESLRGYERLAREIADGVKAGEIKGLDPGYATEVAQKIGAILDAAVGPVSTSVQQPELPTQEVYNPADAQKCSVDDVM